MALNSKVEASSSNLDQDYKLNLNWINLNYENLLLDYENKYVAVKDKNDIDSDLGFLKLLKRIEFNYKGNGKSIVHIYLS